MRRRTLLRGTNIHPFQNPFSPLFLRWSRSLLLSRRSPNDLLVRHLLRRFFPPGEAFTSLRDLPPGCEWLHQISNRAEMMYLAGTNECMVRTHLVESRSLARL